MTLHRDKRTPKQQGFSFISERRKCSEFFLWGQMFRIRLHGWDELEQTSLLRPARETMVLDPVEWSQGAGNVDK